MTIFCDLSIVRLSPPRCATSQVQKANFAILLPNIVVVPYVPQPTLETIISLLPLSKYPNNGPPGSGIEWSRTVALANAVAMKCGTHDMAGWMAPYTNVWKCAYSVILPFSYYRNVSQEA